MVIASAIRTTGSMARTTRSRLADVWAMRWARLPNRVFTRAGELISSELDRCDNIVGHAGREDLPPVRGNVRVDGHDRWRPRHRHPWRRGRRTLARAHLPEGAGPPRNPPGPGSAAASGAAD